MDTDTLVNGGAASSASMSVDASSASHVSSLLSLSQHDAKRHGRSDSLTSISSLSSLSASDSSSSDDDEESEEAAAGAAAEPSSSSRSKRRPLVLGQRVRLVPVDPEEDERKWYLDRGLYGNPFPVELHRAGDKVLTDEQIDAHEWISEDVYDILPLPMFWGEEKLEHEREFRLSFEIMRDFWDTALDTEDEDERRPRKRRMTKKQKVKRTIKVPKSVKRERKAQKQEKRVKALADIVEDDSPCPPVFKRIPRNIFVERKPEKAELPAICTCKLPEGATQGCGQGCINRLMQYSCNPNDCPLGDACSNKPFNNQEGIAEGKDGLRIFYTGDRGWGLRSAVPIKQGQFIMEYRGEIISRDESYRRVLDIYKDSKSFYFLDYDGSDVIDAGRKGNSARFINHSCDPNCHVVRWKLAGFEEYQIGIFALRDIEPLQELSYDYGWQDYSSLASKAALDVDAAATTGEAKEEDKRQRCFCGASTCTGWLGVRREKAGKSKKR